MVCCCGVMGSLASVEAKSINDKSNTNFDIPFSIAMYLSMLASQPRNARIATDSS